jgi:type I restriction enzyme S subunit
MVGTEAILDELKPDPNWAALPLFDRTGWKRVRFGDVVENCAETCDPTEAGLERFVAMEHLEPGSLHVRSWGNVADGTTFTRRCRPGQVLFGKRRAYQRKVAVAEFEAVVSGDIYVLAPKNNKRLLPELLPFLCLSERFFQHAVGTSAGSLSPRTNWSSLASFEFDLPPLDQQRRIAEILWAVDEARQAWLEVVADTSRSRDVLLADLSNQSHSKVACGEILTLASGKAKPKGLRDVAEPGADVPVYGGNGIIGYTEAPLLSFQTLSIGRVGEYCGCVSCITDNSIYVKEHSEKVELRFLYWVLRAANLNKKKKIAGQPLISQATITEESIPLPSISEQRRFLGQLDQFTNAAGSSAEHASRSGKLASAFLDTLLAP